MSLPAAQQRVLDGISAGLTSSEPKLAAIYVTFTRLCASDTPPPLEQLTAVSGARTVWDRARRRGVLVASQVAMAFVLLTIVVSIGFRGQGSRCGAPLRGGTVTHPHDLCQPPTLSRRLAGK